MADFGGKKAAPFVKGGGRKRALAVARKRGLVKDTKTANVRLAGEVDLGHTHRHAVGTVVHVHSRKADGTRGPLLSGQHGPIRYKVTGHHSSGAYDVAEENGGGGRVRVHASRVKRAHRTRTVKLAGDADTDLAHAKTHRVLSKSGAVGIKIPSVNGSHYKVGKTYDGTTVALHFPSAADRAKGAKVTHLGRHKTHDEAMKAVRRHITAGQNERRAKANAEMDARKAKNAGKPLRHMSVEHPAREVHINPETGMYSFTGRRAKHHTVKLASDADTDLAGAPDFSKHSETTLFSMGQGAFKHTKEHIDAELERRWKKAPHEHLHKLLMGTKANAHHKATIRRILASHEHKLASDADTDLAHHHRSITGARGHKIHEGDYVSHHNDATSKMRAVEISHVTGKVRVQNDFQTGAKGTWIHAAHLVPYGHGKGQPPRPRGLVHPKLAGDADTDVNLAGSGKARVSIRPGTYRGVKGHHISGKDIHGRTTRVFVPGERHHAVRAVANIKVGRSAFDKSVV